MKPGNKLIIENGRKVSEKAQDQDSEDSSGSVGAKIVKSPLFSDMVKFFVAIMVASLVYFIASVVISEEMNYFLRHLLCLVLSIMALYAFNTVQKTVPIIGRAVIILLCIFFIYKITDHYFGQPKEVKVKNTQDKDSEQTKDLVPEVLVLHPGIHPFELEDSASSGWLTIPPSGRYRYTISSPSYSYKIVFPDGRVYQGNPKAVIPWNRRPVFKLLSSKKETISVEITAI